MIGIQVFTQPGWTYPFHVSVNLNNIGGPSAGLAFTLGTHRHAQRWEPHRRPHDLGDRHDLCRRRASVRWAEFPRRRLPSRTHMRLCSSCPQAEVTQAKRKATSSLHVFGVTSLQQALQDLESLGGKLGRGPQGPPAGPGGHSLPGGELRSRVATDRATAVWLLTPCGYDSVRGTLRGVPAVAAGVVGSWVMAEDRHHRHLVVWSPRSRRGGQAYIRYLRDEVSIPPRSARSSRRSRASSRRVSTVSSSSKRTWPTPSIERPIPSSTKRRSRRRSGQETAQVLRAGTRRCGRHAEESGGRGIGARHRELSAVNRRSRSDAEKASAEQAAALQAEREHIHRQVRARGCNARLESARRESEELIERATRRMPIDGPAGSRSSVRRCSPI